MTISPSDRAWYRLKISEARLLRRHLIYLTTEADAIRRAGLWDDAVCIEATPMVAKEMQPV